MPRNEMDFSLSRETDRDQPLRNLGKVTDGASEQGSPLDGRTRGRSAAADPFLIFPRNRRGEEGR